jgi:branched-chain amino acid aminotransferase
MSDERLVYLSGEWVPASQARIPIHDPAVTAGQSVFEVSRTFNHRPFRLDEHYARLFGSMKYWDIDCGLSREELAAVTDATVEKNIHQFAADEDFMIHHRISNGVADGETRRPLVIISMQDLKQHNGRRAHRYDSGVAAFIPSQRSIPARLLDAKVKSSSRPHYQMAVRQVARIDPDAWALLMDEDGFITEGTPANFMMISDGGLISPEPRNILLGITRGAIIDVAAQLGIPFRETNFGAFDVINADEAFFSQTSSVIMPVAMVDGHSIGSGVPGPITRRLTDGFKEMVGLDFVAQAQRWAAEIAS